jgi:hypothetical protein
MSSPLQKMLADRQALINDIVSYMEVLRNVYGITPEFIWNNISATHRICVNDDSIKRCDDWEHSEPGNYIGASINEGKTTTFIDNYKDCGCEACDEAEEEEAKKLQFNQAYE